MNNFRETGWYPIKGKVALSKDERFFPHIGSVAQTISDHLKRQGMWKVKLETSSSVSFHGLSSAHSGFLTLSKVVGIGFTKISIENSQMVAHYYLRPSFIFALGTFLPLIIEMMEMSIYGMWLDFDWLFSLAIVAVITTGILRFFPNRGMKQELKSAFRKAVEIMDT